MQCEYKRYDDPCQFDKVDHEPMFSLEGKTYCVFHAPIDAQAVGRESLKKDLAEKDLADFNERVLTYARSVVEAHPDYKPPKTMHRTIFLTRLINALEKDFRRGLTDLRGVVFPSKVKFVNLTWTDLDFSDTTFSREVIFENCKFIYCARFDHATFEEGAYYYNCIFEDEAKFEGIRARGPEITWHGSRFKAELSIKDSDFIHNVHICCLDRKAYEDAPDTKKIPYIPALNMENAKFGAYTCFKHREFGLLVMRRANFNEPPDLFDCVVPNSAVFSGATYNKIGTEYFERYNILRRLATQSGDREGAEHFRARAFSSQQRDLKLPRLIRGILWCYGASSRYGTSVNRAILSLLLLNFIFFVLYSFLIGAQTGHLAIEDLNATARFSLQQIFKPFDILSGKALELPGLFSRTPLLWIVLAIGQSLVSISIAGIFLHTVYRFFNRD